jgi:hypothetical protein
MKRTFLVMVLGGIFAVPAQATLLYSFETGTDGFADVTSGVTLTQSTIGATEGVSSLAVSYPGFNWLETPSSQALADALTGNQIVLFDVTYTPESNVGTWASYLISFNDGAHGWRQMGSSIPAASTAPGTYTITLDATNLAAPDYVSGGWFKMSIGMSSDTPSGNATIYFDNIRTAPVPEPATITALALGAIALIRRRRR